MMSNSFVISVTNMLRLLHKLGINISAPNAMSNFWGDPQLFFIFGGYILTIQITPDGDLDLLGTMDPSGSTMTV